MQNIKNAITSDMIHSFCIEINMPADINMILKENFKNIDFDIIEDNFNGLFSVETGLDSAVAIKECFKNDKGEKNGLKALTVFLTAALVTRENYKKLGIKDKIFIDTMKIFSRFVNEHLVSFGEYGFNREWWIYRNLSCVLFRLGELEFEMKYIDDEDTSGWAKKGTPVLSVHIPSDAVMTRTELDNSYDFAKKFFQKYFPGFNYAFAFCSSWLLSAELKNLLPPTSKILEFQSDYEIISSDNEDTSYMEWVFKNNYTDYSLFPEKTSLQRSIKNHVLNGGVIGSGFGININKNLVKSETHEADFSVIGNFLDENGKIKSYPAKYSKKLLIHSYLAEKFEFDVVYTEKEVNKIISDWILFDDYATLRRALIDYKFMERKSNGSDYKRLYK